MRLLIQEGVSQSVISFGEGFIISMDKVLIDPISNGRGPRVM
jgi:hypothetical protein